MENRIEVSLGTEIPRKSRSLDVKSLYRSRSGKEVEKQSLKRKGSEENGDENGEKRKKNKKSRKEAAVSCVKNVNSSNSSRKRSTDKACRRGLSSGLHDPEALKTGSNEKLDSSGGLNGVPQLSLDSNGVQIPRRKRGFVGRKKIEGGQGVKLSDESADKASLVEQDHQIAKLNGDGLCQAEVPKAERNKGLDECKESINNKASAASHVKKENVLESQSVVSNGNLTLKKSQRKRRKKKNLSSDSRTDAKEAEPLVDSSTKACQASHEDEEENLEENAAMMLSSRFDPSCTGFSLNTKASGSNQSSPSQDFNNHVSKSSSGSESPSVDNAGRVLRPRTGKQHREKKGTRKRRHFYEIFFGDLDACWVVNRRIKVFWPLDQSWYYGLVNDYDKEKKVHHIRYDDREEEWIDLQHERFKLLLLPTEVPGKAKQKKSLIQIKSSEEREGNSNPRKEKRKRDLMLEDDRFIGSGMDSEPIISWLARSTRRIKSPFHAKKKQNPSGLSPKSVPTLSDSAHTLYGCLGNASSRRDTNKLSSDSGRSSNALREEKSALEDNDYPEDGKMPIVYYRKRLRKTGSVLSQIYEDEHASMHGHHYSTSVTPVVDIWDLEEPDNFVAILDRSWPLWYADDAGLLKLTHPWVESGKVIFKCLQLRSLINDFLGVEWLRFFHAAMLLRHGMLVMTWPKVQLEMLFVDNVVGLRFLLFEGCLNQAVVLVFLILTLFHHPDDQGKLTDFQLPATSIRFKFSCVQQLGKQLVFAFYNFCRVKNSKWMHLDNKLGRHCLLTKKLPLSECTYDNIQALQNGLNQSSFMSLFGQPSPVKGTQKRPRQGINFMGGPREVSFVNISHSDSHSGDLHRKLPPLALSFTAAPTFFINLHLKLLMEHSVANICFHDHDSEVTPQHDLIAPEKVATTGPSCAQLVTETSVSICSHQGQLKSSQLYEKCVVNVAGNTPRTYTGSDKAVTSPRPVVNGLTVEIPSFDKFEKPVGGELQSAQQPTDFSLNMNGSTIPSPSPTAPRSTGQRSRNSLSSFGNLSSHWSDGKADIFHNGFANGPKKPRTQVSYMPYRGFDVNSKQRNIHKGLPNKRIRRASEKKSLDTCRGIQRNLELLSCEANVLISASDRGWRENGARVVLEQFDNSEWKLAVKLSGTTKYSYKAHQFLQPGSTNRYTHVMMWKGGKDWILEFPDRSQWALFKEMHEECYNRNLRSASVKNIPIPGVRLVEDIDDNGTEISFLRGSTKYFQQMKTDVEMALDPSRLLYDMDSDDERWISRNQNSSELVKSCSVEIGEEMFEKVMDMFEKAAYVRQCDQFTAEEIEEFMTGVGPMDLIKTIYEHWRQKRLKKGMALIRHLQPPSWEMYQKQVREWEQAMTKMNTTLANGGREKAAPTEKPPMYAFCLKPRGLEVLNKGSKQRSQKRFSISAHTNAVLGDQDAFHPIGRRTNGFAFGDEKYVYSGHNYESLDDSPLSQTSPGVFSPRDAGNILMSNDAFERNHLQRIDRNKSKNYRTMASPVEPQIVSPYSVSPYGHRVVRNRNGVHRGNIGYPQWSSQSYYQPDVAQRFVNAQGFDHDELRLRDASGAAQHAHNIAKRKRENARRLFYRADLAMHKAVVALMTAEAIKASSDDYDYEYDSESESLSLSDSDTDSDSEE
ncbi:uncharacterized protein LOC126782989 [Argentina anserina]|uniref:uncharacterized protein LOC126782989 n=1 Tax=Argentina anserina TaxID=57926 RepID=UPI0021762F96|nr:uncharacterized protein LOC126782989 [Potentilla anserina]